MQIHLCSVKVIGHFSDKASETVSGGRPLPCYLRHGRRGGVDLEEERSQQHVKTPRHKPEGQPGYQETEVALEQYQVMGDPCLLRDFHRTLEVSSVTWPWQSLNSLLLLCSSQLL